MMFGYLRDAGAIDDGIAASYEARGMRCSGYFIPEDGDRVDLFLCIPRLDGAAGTITKTEIQTGFRRLKEFLTKAFGGLHKDLEEASDGYDMARSIWQARTELVQARLFVLTDAVARVEKIENETIEDTELTFHVWDLTRTFRADVTGGRHEPVHVDFPGLRDEPVRGILVSPPDSGYRCFLAVLPGDLLVDIYARYGPRLLERNVRSFLQLKGKVNQGIRKTILEEPQMFLAFNNGLSITASGLTLREHGDGTADLLEARDFQIVNGGQTTGSIYRAARKDKAEVKVLQVPIKITEILDDGDVDDIAPRISQSANTQNKINMADFTSNHPYHRKLQELSRQIWAPPPVGLQKQTQWFYERARGQYHDALALGTPAARKAFEATHPRRQVIEKTDVAKFENTWDQLPYIVSRGAQKCYLHFMDTLDKAGPSLPDDRYFRRLVAKAILFKRTEKIVSALKFGGYRANIVTYSLAWLSHRTAKRIDPDAIWNAQALSPSLETAIETIAIAAHAHISTPPGGQNVTEWCKKEACWSRFREVGVELPAGLEAELLTTETHGDRTTPPTAQNGADAEEAALIDSVGAIAADTWFGLAAWAKETQTLQPWQRGLAYSLGRLASNQKKPSIKQATQGQRILPRSEGPRIRGLKSAPLPRSEGVRPC